MIKTKGTAIAEKFAGSLSDSGVKALAAEIDCAIALAVAHGQRMGVPVSDPSDGETRP